MNYLKIYQRRLVIETAFTSVVVTLVVVTIYLVGKIVALLRRAVQGNVPTEDLLEILLTKTVAFLDVIFAPVLFLSILLVLTRWSRDRETTILAASGIGPFNYMVVVSLVVLGAASIVTPLSLYFIPKAERIYSQLLQEFKHQSVYAPIEHGEFITSDDGRRVIFISTGSHLPDEYRLFFYQSHSPELESIAIAKSGAFNPNPTAKGHTLQLNKGTQYWLTEDNPGYELVQYGTLTTNLDTDVQFEFNWPINAKPTSDLIGSDNPAEKAELMWRISKVAMVPIVVIAAFVLGCVPLGNGTGVNLLTSVAIFFVYNSLISFSVEVIRQGAEFGHLMLWFIHGLALVLVAVVVFRFLDNKPALPGILQSKL